MQFLITKLHLKTNYANLLIADAQEIEMNWEIFDMAFKKGMDAATKKQPEFSVEKQTR